MAKMRSPNYPAVGLSQCIASARSLWNKERRTAVSPEVAAKAIGYGGLNGPARTTLSALKKYGLLDEVKEGIRLSDRAIALIHAGESSKEYLDALREAALEPEIFRELFETHAHASDEALKSYLLMRKKFTDEGVKQFIRAFRDTQEVAKLTDSVYNPPPKEADMNMEHAGIKDNKQQNSNVKVLNFLLGKDVTAEVRIVADELKPSHLDGLCRHLELTKSLMEANEVVNS